MPSTLVSSILQLASVLSAAAAAALWLKSSMIRMTPLRIGGDRTRGQDIILLTGENDPVLLAELHVKLSRLTESLRHQVRWTAIGARFAALAILLQLLKQFL